MKNLIIAVVVLVSIADGFSQSRQMPCAVASDLCKGVMNVSPKKVYYYRNFKLGKPNSEITSAVIMIHGNGRNPRSYFNTTLDSARIASARGIKRFSLFNTLLIAPSFQTSSDLSVAERVTHWFWSSGGWKVGNKAVGGGKSSFSVVDHIISKLIVSGRFINLKTVIIAGHSAGGQYVQRYAMSSVFPKKLSDRGITVKFVVANPSSYAYLNNKRRRTRNSSQFVIPYVTIPIAPFVAPHPNFAFVPQNQESSDNSKRNMFCPPTYNKYKYGLQFRNSYLSQINITRIRNQYKQRKVVYFLGTADNQSSSSLAKSCPAMVQGKHRYERGKNFKKFMDKFYHGHRHSLVKASGVGHTASGMFKSLAGVQLLFN
ncbi:MAG: hypothetical protein HOE90_24900 [Bacteriovoracaceae bacterium]|jgi:hypothetical protein|nr:hypothetical protein [Bacteriovoracaceae bacterium]